jgi:transcription elongation factor Elf1
MKILFQVPPAEKKFKCKDCNFGLYSLSVQKMKYVKKAYNENFAMCGAAFKKIINML